MASGAQLVKNGLERVFDRDSFVLSGGTEFEVVYHDGLSKLRRYKSSTAAPTHKTPLLFVMPLAVGPQIYDLLPNQSLIQTLVDQGFDVYLTDWGKPSRKDAHLGFKEYVVDKLPLMIKVMQQLSDSKDYSLHGWSMGGFFCLFHACYSKDPHLKNLVLCGTPANPRNAGPLGSYLGFLSNMFGSLESRTGLHPLMLPSKVVHSNGWLNALTFKLVDPIGTVKSYTNMFKNLGNRTALEENATKADFLLKMLDYPGQINKDVMDNIWLHNKLYKGEMILNEKRLELESISCSLLVIAGNRDPLVSPTSAKAVFKKAKSIDTEFIEAKGGHVGILSSKLSQKDVWPKLASWLSLRSN